MGQFEVGDWAISGSHFTLSEFLELEPVGVDRVGKEGVGLSEAVVEVLGVLEFVLDGGEIPPCGVCQVIIQAFVGGEIGQRNCLELGQQLYDLPLAA